MIVKLHLEKSKNPTNEFAIEDDFAMDLGLITGAPSVDSLTGKDRIIICDAYMVSDMTKKVYLKDLFFSGHPGIIKRSFTEVMLAAGRGSGGKLSSAERLRYDDTLPTITVVNELDEGSHYLAGTSDGRQAAFAGGSSGPSDIKRLRFDDTAVCYVFTNSLSHDKRGAAGVSSHIDAIYGGGVTDENRIDRIRYDDSVPTVTLTNSLSTGRHYVAAAGDRNQICFAGGVNSSIGNLSSIEKLKYDDTTVSTTLTNGLLNQRQRLSGSAIEYEMIFNGHNDNTQTLIASQLEKMRFDDSMATVIMSNTYSLPTHSSTAQSNGIDTLLIAGGNRLGDGASTARVESVKFDDSAAMAHINALSQNRWGLASAQGY